MSTYREVVFMIMDYLKISSDDAYYTPDHIKFMLNKYRAYVLKSKYENPGSKPSDQNYQTLSFPLVETFVVDGYPCRGKYLKTVEPVPEEIEVGSFMIYAGDVIPSTFNFVSPQRFRFVGHGRYARNQVYVTKGSDSRLYLKSCNPELYYLESIGIRGIFTDPDKAAAFSGDANANCLPMDVEFPLEDNLLPLVMQYVVKEFNGAEYRPQDTENNASDDLSTLAQFIRTYMKAPLRNQIVA